MLGREDLTPGMITGIQSQGELLHWHPHVHALVTCGGFTPTGEFLPLPAFSHGPWVNAPRLIFSQPRSKKNLLDQPVIEPASRSFPRDVTG